MNKKTKKGFTIVELVIVIAVIAILAAVLIPTFSNVIQKAKTSNDVVLVRNLNTALATDGKQHNTMHDAILAAKDFGFDLPQIVAKVETNKILWDSKNDVFCYEQNGEITYIPETQLTVPKAELKNVDYWEIADKLPTTAKYSIYASNNWSDTGRILANNLQEGFDAGYNTVINETNTITYTGGATAQSVIIRTNGGALTLNAPQDTVERYGYCDLLDVQAIKSTSLHEYGTSAMVSITSGRIIFEKEDSTNVVFVAGNNAIVAVAENVEMPIVQRSADVSALVLQTVKNDVGTCLTETKVTIAADGTVATETKNTASQIVETPDNVNIDNVKDTVKDETSVEDIKNETIPITINTYDDLVVFIRNAQNLNGVIGASFDIPEVIEVERDVIINLNGNTLTATLSGGRMFKILAGCEYFEINGQKENSKLQIAAEAQNCFGFVDMNTLCTVVFNGGNYVGAGNGGAFVRLRTACNGSCVGFYDCYMETTGASYGFINSFLEVLSQFEVIGGTYIFGGTLDNCGPFECSYIKARFTNVTCIAAQGPIIENSLYGSTGDTIIEGCYFGKPVGGQSWDAAAVATSNGCAITINSGVYWGQYAAYTYNSGGKIVIKGGEFKGTTAALKADGGSEAGKAEAIIEVQNGTFDGKLIANGSAKDAYINISGGVFINVDFVENNEKSHIIISGGTFDKDPSAFVTTGYHAVDNQNGTWTVVAD